VGIYKRADSPFWWMHIEGVGLKTSTGIPVRGSTPTKTSRLRKDAEDVYATRKADLARGAAKLPVRRREAVSFDTVADWYDTHRLAKQRGHEREREILKRLRADFGKTDIRAITPRAVAEWQSARLASPTIIAYGNLRRTFRAGLSTVNRETDTLKAVLKAAVELGHLDASPLVGMRRLRTVAARRRLMTIDEEDRLLEQLEPDDTAIVVLGLDTLLRLGDILDLRRGDRDGDRLWIQDPKDPTQGEPFYVPLSKRAGRVLDALPAESLHYFPRRRRAKTERDRRNTIRQMLERACAAADPPIPFGRAAGGITFHWATRRTGASRMIANGADIRTVQQIGHWKTPDVVLSIYAESLEADRRRAVELPGKRARKQA